MPVFSAEETESDSQRNPPSFLNPDEATGPDGRTNSGSSECCHQVLKINKPLKNFHSN